MRIRLSKAWFKCYKRLPRRQEALWNRWFWTWCWCWCITWGKPGSSLLPPAPPLPTPCTPAGLLCDWWPASAPAPSGLIIARNVFLCFWFLPNMCFCVYGHTTFILSTGLPCYLEGSHSEVEQLLLPLQLQLELADKLAAVKENRWWTSDFSR